jgi:hypothetical protein
VRKAALLAPFEKALARKLPGNHMFGGWAINRSA